MRFEILRDPLWNNIRVDELTLQLVDTDVFQRLRYVRQLGLAYLVYPGATHTRFEHALGAYHLARGTLALMAERDGLGMARALRSRRLSARPRCCTTSGTIRSPTRWRRSERFTTRTSRARSSRTGAIAARSQGHFGRCR